MHSSANEITGWSLVLVGFVSGAVLGLGFDRDDFLGGYGSFRRRIVRLGHIACVALGMLNVLFASAVAAEQPHRALASALLIAGGIAMPLVCFLTAWRAALRRLFPIPVACLVAAAVTVLVGLLARTGTDVLQRSAP